MIHHPLAEINRWDNFMILLAEINWRRQGSYWCLMIVA